MTLTPGAAHAACAAIVLGDLGIRTVRLRLLARGVGQRVSLRDSFLSTLWGDAAAAVTPLRLGGDAAKLVGLLRAGITLGPCLVILALEAMVSYPAMIGFGSWLLYRFAPAWWAEAGPGLGSSLKAGWPWMVGIAIVTLAGLLWWWHFHPRGRRHNPSIGGRLREAWGEVRWLPVVAALPLSLMNVVGRVALLPLLAMTLPDHPAGPILWVGSFVLLYSQMVLPTPAGAGPVELGFLGGAAGALGPDGAVLLLAWRFYSVGLAVVLGAWAALRVVGWRSLLAALRGRPLEAS